MWHIAFMNNRVFPFALSIILSGAIAEAGTLNHVPSADLAVPLELRAESPTPRYSVPERFHLVVTIRNPTKNALVILPGGIDRVYKTLVEVPPGTSLSLARRSLRGATLFCYPPEKAVSWNSMECGTETGFG